MNNVGDLSELLDSLIGNNKERDLICATQFLELNLDECICYYKGLSSRVNDKPLVLYIFNKLKIIEVKYNDKDDELIEIEIYSKSDVNSIKYITNKYDGNCEVSFSLNNKTISFNSNEDTNNHYKKQYEELIKKIIKYFNN